MITLVFPLAGVLLLAEHAVAATTHEASMQDVLDSTRPRPALWLVADLGVFLMSNGLDTPPGGNDAGGLLVVYADGYRTKADWLAISGQVGRGDDIRIVLPLLQPAADQRVLHRDLTGGAAAGATNLIIQISRDQMRWHVPVPSSPEAIR
jgi:hypothetical protein